MEDSYRSEDVQFAHRFLVILYYAERTKPVYVDANCYADAVEQVAPGNDVIKVEVTSI